MPERLAIAVIPGVGWRASEIQSVAQEAEEAGFDAIFTAEVNNDALGTALLMGTATRRIQVGTWIANIYLRHPYVCAQGAALISDATGGRFILGLGVSHQPVNGALGLGMPDPPAALRQYVTEVRGWLRGEGPATHLPQRPADPPVPVYVSALTSRIVEMGGELADGIMPLFWSARIGWRLRRAGRPEGGPARPAWATWTSRSGCRRSLGTIWEHCATSRASTSGFTPRSRSSSGCSGRVASRRRRRRWSRASGRPRCRIGCWTRSV